MPKTKGVTLEQINAIRYYSQQGYSANQIQRKLQEQKLGMRRTKLLGRVREAKKQPTRPRARVEKHIPIKYRKREVYTVQALPGEAEFERRKRGAEVKVKKRFEGKHISVWRDRRRWEVYGRGEELLDFIRNTGLHYGPRERFKRINAVDLEPDDIGEAWSDRPEIESG